MAKTKLNIEAKIKKLEAIQNLLDHIDTEIEWATKNGEEYLEDSKTEEGEVNTEAYSYKQYLTYVAKKEAFESLREDVEDLAD